MIEPREISLADEPVREQPLFSICTLMTRPEQYDRMLTSFEKYGFVGEQVEYLYIDNSSGNSCSAAVGLNRMINASRGRYLLLCHQDIELLEDGYDVLLARLEELEKLDSNWALAGNSGARGYNELIMHISDHEKNELQMGTLPAAVDSIDENFMVLKKSALLGFSLDLPGYHLYGADICLHARMRGMTTYVIDFYLRHHSGGTLDQVFWRQARWFEEKYRHLFRTQWLSTTCTQMALSHSRLRQQLMRQSRPWRRRLNKLKRRLGMG
jgi:hypothetical protein